MHTIDKAKGIKSSSREFLFFHRQIERQRSRCCYIDTYILHRHIEGNRSRSCTYLYMKERCIQIFLEIEIASHIYSTYIQKYIYIECSMSNNLQYFRMDSNAKCKWKENWEYSHTKLRLIVRDFSSYLIWRYNRILHYIIYTHS